MKRLKELIEAFADPPHTELLEALAAGLATRVSKIEIEKAGVPDVRAEERQLTLKWTRMPDRRELSVTLQVAGMRPETASSQVRIPVAVGRDPVEVALRALAALSVPSSD